METSKQATTVDGQGRRLNDAHFGIFFHDADEIHQAPGVHDAVRVEHDCVFVLVSPRRAKVSDVAAFAFDVLTAITIEKVFRLADFLFQIGERHFFSDPDIRVGGVAEDKEVEIFEPTVTFQSFVSGAKTGEDANGIFVVNGHDDSGAGQGTCVFVNASQGATEIESVTSETLNGEADDRSPETQRDGKQEDDEQDEDGELQWCQAVDFEHVKHAFADDGGCREHQRSEAETSKKNGDPSRVEGQEFEHRHLPECGA